MVGMELLGVMEEWVILNEPVRQNVYMDDATPDGLLNPVCCADGIVHLADLF